MSTNQELVDENERLRKELQEANRDNARLASLLQEFKNREMTFHADLEWLIRVHNVGEETNEGG